VYDGEGLASKGLVVVVINYRVGIFGFMAHPELTKESGHNASGNYGLLDMAAALHWVKSNIGAFGGDASNVTIAGQSAGAFAVNYLVASPLTKGLFNRAIAESGGVFNSSQTLQQGEANGVAFQQKLGAANLKEMRAKSADAIQNGGGRGGPIVDGYMISKSVADIFAAGEQNDVPTILGWNADDGTNFNPPPTPEAFRANATRMYGEHAEDFLKAFPSTTQAETTESQRALSRIPTFAWQSHAWADAQSKSAKSKVYLYFFNRVAPGTPEQTKYGAHHTGEVPYALNTLAMWDRPFEPADRKLADDMSSYWVNFAKTGNPDGKGLPAWPAYSPSTPQSMEMSPDLRAIPTPDQARFGFFDAFYASRRAQR
jgi:para-nitrobenzyl esterase